MDLRFRRQRPCQGGHLLFAAGEQPRGRIHALVRFREQADRINENSLAPRSEIRVLAYGQRREDRQPLCHMHQPCFQSLIAGFRPAFVSACKYLTLRAGVIRFAELHVAKPLKSCVNHHACFMNLRSLCINTRKEGFGCKRWQITRWKSQQQKTFLRGKEWSAVLSCRWKSPA